MKSGMSLVDMAHELERQREVKRDFVADTSQVAMSEDAKVMRLGDIGEFAIKPHAHKQFATKLNVPVAFYERMVNSHPDLIAGMVNQLMVREPQKAMFRTLDNAVRSVQSDSFRPLDNYDLFDAVYPALRDYGATVESCNLSDTKFYIKCLCPWLDRELPMPEGLKMGVGHNIFLRRVVGAIVISNSEVGMGALSVSPAMFERQCTNLATFKDSGYGKIHVGKRKGQEDSVFEYLSDATRRLDDAAVWSRVRDVVKATMEGRVIDDIVAKMTEARGDMIEGDPAKVVEVFAKKNAMNDDERGGLLRHLTNSGEMTRYGLQWAVTRLAGDVEDYDRASELERLGGQVIELPRSEWKVLSKAA